MISSSSGSRAGFSETMMRAARPGTSQLDRAWILKLQVNVLLRQSHWPREILRVVKQQVLLVESSSMPVIIQTRQN